jgi:hypothetical protein
MELFSTPMDRSDRRGRHCRAASSSRSYFFVLKTQMRSRPDPSLENETSLVVVGHGFTSGRDRAVKRSPPGESGLPAACGQRKRMKKG